MIQILNDRQISQKLRRLAIAIVEQNSEEAEIVLAGINVAGNHLAILLREELMAYAPELATRIVRLRLQPADPLNAEVACDCSPDTFHNRAVILVDDVANTGRTLFYAFKPLLGVIPRKVQIAVLIDRKHKTYPVHVDYVGLSLATTLHEHIQVRLDTAGERAVYLS
jgi:pyrimidine operon attenuation protein / uracil phosphoribosyltransferase